MLLQWPFFMLFGKSRLYTKTYLYTTEAEIISLPNSCRDIIILVHIVEALIELVEPTFKDTSEFTLLPFLPSPSPTRPSEIPLIYYLTLFHQLVVQHYL